MTELNSDQVKDIKFKYNSGGYNMQNLAKLYNVPVDIIMTIVSSKESADITKCPTCSVSLDSRGICPQCGQQKGFDFAKEAISNKINKLHEKIVVIKEGVKPKFGIGDKVTYRNKEYEVGRLEGNDSGFKYMLKNPKGRDYVINVSESSLSESFKKEAMELQKKYCDEKGQPFFAPSDGRCFKCKKVIPDDGTKLITGCPFCNTSFVESISNKINKLHEKFVRRELNDFDGLVDVAWDLYKAGMSDDKIFADIKSGKYNGSKIHPDYDYDDNAIRRAIKKAKESFTKKEAIPMWDSGLSWYDIEIKGTIQKQGKTPEEAIENAKRSVGKNEYNVKILSVGSAKFNRK